MPNLDQCSELSVCADCLAVIANGDTTGIPTEDYAEWALGVHQWEAMHPRHHIVPGAMCDDPDCDHQTCAEEGFSWRPCDYCNRPLGGDRHTCVTWDTTP